MRFFNQHAPLAVLVAGAFALPQSVTKRDGPWEHPIAHVPQSVAPQSFGTPPKVIYLNKTDLMTPGTVVPGTPGEVSARSTLQERYVIGTDDRVLQTKKGNPWDYIGSFAWSDGGRCSASLVGPRHLATARHCFDRTAGSTVTYQFRPNYDQGTRGYTTAAVTTVLYINGELGDTCSYGDDWAVMILDQRLGDKYGYFGVKQFDSSKAGQAIFWSEGRSFFHSNS